MEFNFINNLAEFESIIEKELGVLFYFSRNTCNVGEAVEPKVRQLIQENFPNIKYYLINMDAQPEISSKYSVFIEPTILIYFDKKEYIRKSRNFSITELKAEIDRLYKLVY